MKKLGLKKFVLAFVLIFLIGAVIFVIAPYHMPWGEQCEAMRPDVEKVPADKNAWVEYRQALDIGEVKQLKDNPVPDWISSNPENLSFTKEQKAYLDRFNEAIPYLVKGAQKPQAQLSDVPGSINIYDYKSSLWLKQLAEITSAQSLRLIAEGNAQKAHELAITAYRVMTDLREPHNNIILYARSLKGRRVAERCLFECLARPDSPRVSLERMLNTLHEENTGCPSFEQILIWDEQFSERVVEDQFATHTPGTKNQMTYWFRRNVVSSFIREHRGIMKDRSKVDELDKKWNWVLRHPSIPEYFARDLLALMVPNVLSFRERYYVSRSNSVALEALAAVMLYKQAHGKYPDSLTEAMKGFGFAAPSVPDTAEIVGYRLEKGEPVIWLWGPDRKDNGGKESYQEPPWGWDEERDLIYRPGSVPRWTLTKYSTVH